MNDLKLEIKLAYVNGLREIVLGEISQHTDFRVIDEDDDAFYLDFVSDLDEIKSLRSVSRAYIVVRDSKYNPIYLSNHKSIFGNIIEIILNGNKDKFKTFKISCAGAGSPEMRRIAEYVQRTYGLVEAEEADLKIHVIKPEETWEIGIQITPRPLSLRDYKVKNMSGAMDPTIAYALNTLCELQTAETYLNAFCGSATLLIEAGQCYPNLKQLIGFDNNKKHISLAIQNITKAGLIKRIQLKEKDIFDRPDFGMFDVIVSDLPFGMVISKDEDLEMLYLGFVEYAQGALNPDGTLAIYTSEHEMLKNIISKSKFKIIKTLDLQFVTSVNAYLRPKIFVCKFK